MNRTFTNSTIAKVGWLTVNFKPEWQSNGQLYILMLRGSSADGIQVAFSLKPEYFAGKLFENDNAIRQDMIFQYGCLAGLQKLFQTGK